MELRNNIFIITFPNKSLAISKNFYKFVPSYPNWNHLKVDVRGLIHIHKRRTERFVFDVLELRKSNWIFYKYLIIKHSYLIINFWETKQKQKWRETRFCSFTCFPCFLSCQIPSFLCLDEKTIVRFVGLICFLRTTWLGVSFPYNQFGCWNPSVKLAIALSLVRRFFAVKGRKTSCTSSTVLCFCSWRKRSLRFSSFRRTYIQFTLG